MQQDFAAIELRRLVPVAVHEHQEPARPVAARAAGGAVPARAQRHDLLAHDRGLAGVVHGVEQGVEFHALNIAGLERAERGQAERQDDRRYGDRQQEFEE